MNVILRCAIAVTVSAPSALATGWTFTSSMASPHEVDQASTPLADGRLLVVGGLGSDDTTVATAEVYDPISAVWSRTQPLAVPRSGHSVTLLANGRVLAAGGYDQMPCYPACGLPVHDTAEIYDPATNAWTATGDLTTARGGHTATRLHGGKVLIAGGFDATLLPLATAEIYDPATGTFTATAPMLTPRWAHTAALLADGRVLVAGGFPGDPTPPIHGLTSAEIFDPATGAWSTTGSMHTGRMWHEAITLSTPRMTHATSQLKALQGQVLVTGGIETLDPSTFPSFFGLKSTEIYDLKSGTWISTGDLVVGRIDPTLTLLANGQLLVAGGEDSDLNVLQSAELYAPATGAWTLTASMNIPRTTASATALPDGTVLVAGGFSINQPQVTAEIYIP